MHAGIFVVRLESDKAVYRLGEPNWLRVTVRNNTPRRYAVMWMQVWGLCDLTVLNSEGQSLSSTGNRGGFVWGRRRCRVLSRRGYRCGFSGFSGSPAQKRAYEWANLNIGIRLNRPGEYTITALPTLGAWEVSGQPGERRA